MDKPCRQENHCDCNISYINRRPLSLIEKSHDGESHDEESHDYAMEGTALEGYSHSTGRSVKMRVAIIEDNPRYRDSLEMLFTQAEGFDLAASFESGQAAVEEADTLLQSAVAPDWDLALMDINLPGLNGIETTRRLKERLPDLAVVVLTVFEEPKTILEAISAGADGYLLKKASAIEILSQLRMIRSGGAPLTAGVARTVLQILRATSHESDPPAAAASLNLTEREQEVLQGLVRGFAYKQVANHLCISIDTVRSHVRAVYKKLQVHSVAEAVARAIRDKLV